MLKALALKVLQSQVITYSTEPVPPAFESDDCCGGHEFQFSVSYRQCAPAAQNKDQLMKPITAENEGIGLD